MSGAVGKEVGEPVCLVWGSMGSGICMSSVTSCSRSVHLSLLFVKARVRRQLPLLMWCPQVSHPPLVSELSSQAIFSPRPSLSPRIKSQPPPHLGLPCSLSCWLFLHPTQHITLCVHILCFICLSAVPPHPVSFTRIKIIVCSIHWSVLGACHSVRYVISVC